MFAARQGVVTRTATSTPGPSTLRRRRRRVCISASQIPQHVLDSLSSFRNFCSQSTRCQEFHGRQHSHRYQSKPTSSSSQSNVARKPHRQGYNARPGWNGSTSTTARTSQVGNFSSIDQEEAFLSLSDGFASPRVPYPDAKVASTSSSYARETADYSAFFDSVEESADSWDAKGKAKAVPRYHWSLRATSRLRGSQRKRFTTIREAMQTKRRLKPKLPECANEKDPFYKNIQAYTSLFTPAIRAELLQHEAVLKERLTEKTLEQLKAEGYCIDDMAGFWRGTLELGKHVAVFSLGPGITLPEGHRFEQGKQVLLSQNSPLTDKDVHRGTVMAVSDTQLKVYFEEERRFPLTALDGRTPLRWRLDLGQSNIVFERMEAAIKSLWHDPQQYEDESEYAMAGTHLRDILLKNFSPGADPIPLSDDPNLAMDQSPEDVAEKLPGEGGWGGGAFSGDARIQSWVNRYSLPVPLVMEGDMPIHNLNSSQIRAMSSMIGNRLSLVQGPPGTGKTKTIIETLKLLKLHFQVPHPILVCTYTNVAVDNLVEGLAAAGVKPLRVGAVGSVRPSLLQHTLAAKLEAHPLFSAHQDLVDQEEKIKKELEEMHAKVHSAETELKDKKEGRASKAMIGRIANMMATKSALERKEAVVKGKKNAVKQAMLREVTSEADVICSTCITSATYDLNVVDFPVVFLDEASMATEPVSLIPLMKGCQHLALIGDHRQLPPVILSKEAQKLGLGVSLFERLTKEGVVPSVMLDTQYRMHPDISNFPSNEFYLGTLRDGTVDEQGRVSRDLFPPMSQYLDLDLNLEKLGAFRSEYQYREEKGQGVEESKPRPSVIFLDHSGREGMKDKSRINRTEAHIIANVVVDLLLSNPDLQGKDIGIIAPYVAQISLLTRIFNSPDATSPSSYGSKFRSVLGDTLALQQLPQIEIKTVDGFEGREKDVIIFSTVRNNAEGNIGFLADRRRLNVGLTRAKRALFVVGNIGTLKEGKVSGGRVGIVTSDATADSGEGEVVVAEKGKGTVRVGKGAESWRRYAQYLLERGLVVHVDKDDIMENGVLGDEGEVSTRKSRRKSAAKETRDLELEKEVLEAEAASGAVAVISAIAETKRAAVATA